MSTRRFALTALTVATLASGSSAARADFLGPSAYLSAADSPFNGLTFTYSHLETFEDGLLNTPGATASDGAVIGPGGAVDSVDGDDGAIDGSGSGGRSLFSGGVNSFTFSAAALGSLPTHAGIVWTDGSGTITFEAFDQNNVSLGTLTGSHADGDFSGTTAEDRFYGVTNPGGISRIRISNPAGLEVDHLQYGAQAIAIPEPASLVLLGAGAIGLLGYGRRCPRRSTRRSLP